MTPALVRRAMQETRLLPKLQQPPGARQPDDPHGFPTFFDESFQPAHTSEGDKKAACWQAAHFAGCTGSLSRCSLLSGWLVLVQPQHRLYRKAYGAGASISCGSYFMVACA